MNDEMRFARLERETRRLRIVCAGLTLALVTLTAIGAGAAGSGIFSAKSFAVVDGSGATRVRIDEQGFHLLDSSGRERLSAVFDGKTAQPKFTLNDTTGRARFDAYIDTNTQAYLALLDAKYTRAILGSVDGTTPQLWFGDSTGNRRLIIGMSVEKNVRDSIPYIGLGDKSGQTAFFGPNNVAFGTKKTSRAYFGRFGTFPGFEIYDKPGTERGFFGIYNNGSAGAYFKDPTGTLIWQAQ